MTDQQNPAAGSSTDPAKAAATARETDPARERALARARAYPRHWVADVLASDGGVVHLRPIVPEDAEGIVAFHSKLSERTRYLRYFGPYPTISKNFFLLNCRRRLFLATLHLPVGFVVVFAGFVILDHHHLLHGANSAPRATSSWPVALRSAALSFAMSAVRRLGATSSSRSARIE